MGAPRCARAELSSTHRASFAAARAAFPTGRVAFAAPRAAFAAAADAAAVAEGGEEEGAAAEVGTCAAAMAGEAEACDCLTGRSQRRAASPRAPSGLAARGAGTEKP